MKQCYNCGKYHAYYTKGFNTFKTICIRALDVALTNIAEIKQIMFEDHEEDKNSAIK